MANNNRDFRNTNNDQQTSNQGWREDYDHSSLGSLGVSGYDSEFRSGRGSWYDRDTGYVDEERAGLSLSSMFGEDESRWTNPNRTAHKDRGEHYGRGPEGYKRSDERIEHDIHDHLTQHSYIDATNIVVTVKDGEVILEGTVPDRDQKHYAEEAVEEIHGVTDVQNRLRIQTPQDNLTSTNTGKQRI